VSDEKLWDESPTSRHMARSKHSNHDDSDSQLHTDPFATEHSVNWVVHFGNEKTTCFGYFLQKHWIIVQSNNYTSNYLMRNWIFCWRNIGVSPKLFVPSRIHDNTCL